MISRPHAVQAPRALRLPQARPQARYPARLVPWYRNTHCERGKADTGAQTSKCPTVLEPFLTVVTFLGPAHAGTCSRRIASLGTEGSWATPQVGTGGILRTQTNETGVNPDIIYSGVYFVPTLSGGAPPPALPVGPVGQLGP